MSPDNRCGPDFSEFVVHFTKSSPPHGVGSGKPTVECLANIAKIETAYDRLVSILTERTVRATNMPWTHRPCVCFTECVWGSLLDHAQRYSCYGLGFHKELLFRAGGGPALYMRQDLYQEQVAKGGWSEAVWPFVTPFVPSYAPAEHLAKHWRGSGSLDYSFEREWRVPHDLKFEYSDVAFVIMDTYVDEARMERDLKDAVGRSNILLMDNYRRVNDLWPWHHY